MNILSIQEHIDNTYNEAIDQSLQDTELLPILLSQKSVKKIKQDLIQIFEKYHVNNSELIEELLIKYIPPGTKGVVRGRIFNESIRNIIESMEILNGDDFIYKFEENHPDFHMDEIPDWYIYHIPSNTILIGMNQLDLWSGGHQTNRGSKYILNENNNSRMKVLCIVCNYFKIKHNTTSKILKFFQVGFEKQRLCYPNHLEMIIHQYFNL